MRSVYTDAGPLKTRELHTWSTLLDGISMHLNQNTADVHTFGLLFWPCKYLALIKGGYLNNVNKYDISLHFFSSSSSLSYTHLALGSGVLFD